MSEDDLLLNFSGETPEELVVADEVFLNSTTATTTTTESVPTTVATTVLNTILKEIAVTTTASAPIPTTSEYELNPFRIGFLAFKCILIILLITLTCTIRRDFFKFFVIALIIPLFIEAGFDVFTEIHASTAIFGVQKYNWDYLNLAPHDNETVTDWQKHAIDGYGEILSKYTTYQLFKSDTLFSIASYVLADFFFWSLLFSTTTVYFYAHKAVVRPEQIAYEPIGLSFLKVQILPILFTTIDTMLSIFVVPWYVYLGVIFIVRITACLLSFVIVTQMFASLFLFCRSKDEITKTSPYEQVRNSKIRLFLFVIFTLAMMVLNVPYLIWCGISLAYDVGQILNFNWYLPLYFAYELFPLHLTTFLIRSYAFLILSLILLNPYRRRFVRFFCGCCRKN